MQRLTLASVLVASTGLLLPPSIQGQDTHTRFEVEPSTEYLQLVRRAPAEFNWEQFARRVRLRVTPGTGWPEDSSRAVRLFAVGIQEAKIVERAASSAFEVLGRQAVESIDFPEHLPTITREWVPETSWFPVDHWVPDADWVPVDQWVPHPDVARVVRSSPGDFARAALGEGDEESRVLVVYATFADEDLRDKTILRPFGLVFRRR